jgi:hypothetical protein
MLAVNASDAPLILPTARHIMGWNVEPDLRRR